MAGFGRAARSFATLSLIAPCFSACGGGAELAAVPARAAALASLAPGAGPGPAAPAAEPAPATNPAPVDWPSIGDCRDQLRYLQRLVARDQAPAPEALPFAVTVGDLLERARLVAPPVPIKKDLPIAVDSAGAATVPCLIQVSRAENLRARRRIVGQEDVESEYQTGTRRDDNPEYEVARVKVKQAERHLKEDGVWWGEVGDPMMDLVGMLIGSIAAGFSGRNGERELNDAMMALATTPRKVDSPIYAPYHFERVLVDAAKRADIPVALIDRAHGRAFRTTIRRTEQRRFHIPQGLSQRDRNYTEHAHQSITRRELTNWQRTPPEVRLSELVAAVLDSAGAGRSTSPSDDAARSPWASGRGSIELDEPDDLDLLPAAGPSTAGQLEDPVSGSASGFEEERLGAVDDAPPWSGAQRAPPAVAGDDGDGTLDLPPEVDAAFPSADFRGALRSRLGARSVQSPTEVANGDPADADPEDGLEGGNDADWFDPYRRRTLTKDRQSADTSGDQRFASVVEIKSDDGLGSGFYIRPNLILTNYHVVTDSALVDLTTMDGATVAGIVVGTDAGRDLALVHSPRTGHPAPLYDGPPLRPGLEVEAIGSPHGFDFSLTRGIISAVRERPALLVPELQRVRYVQTDAAINQGNSGGPLFLGEHVVGVNNWARSAANGGLNFAIHAEEVRDFLREAGIGLPGTS
jgi:S1-C subfamily serine protease